MVMVGVFIVSVVRVGFVTGALERDQISRQQIGGGELRPRAVTVHEQRRRRGGHAWLGVGVRGRVRARVGVGVGVRVRARARVGVRVRRTCRAAWSCCAAG